MNNTTITSSINPYALADTFYFLKPYGYFDSTLVRMKSLVAEVICRDNVSAEAASRYVNVYGRSAENCFLEHETQLSDDWAFRQERTKVELTKLLCFVNSKCRETLLYMKSRLDRLNELDNSDQSMSDIEIAELKKLRKVLAKYNFADTRTLRFLNTFVTTDNVVDIAAEISAVFHI